MPDIIFKICILILLTFFAEMASAQDDTPYPGKDSNYVQLHTIQGNTAFFTTDVLQNVYAITRKGELVKYNELGEKMYAYSEFSLGEAGQVDATNPFLLLLYYPEFQTVVSLDNTLAKTGEYTLYDLDLLSIEAICFSNDGNIWFYDPIEFKVRKIDRRGKTLLSSNSLNFILEKSINPNFIVERGTWLYVNDPDTGILVFDVYGQYFKTLPILDLSSFQVIGRNLLYANGNELFAYNLDSFANTQIALPNTFNPTDIVRIEKNRLYLANDEGIAVFKF